MLRLLAAVTVSLAALVATANAAPPAARIGITCAGVSGWARGAQVEPTRVMLACGDANYWIAALDWHGWGTTTARATGGSTTTTAFPTAPPVTSTRSPAPRASRS